MLLSRGIAPGERVCESMRFALRVHSYTDSRFSHPHSIPLFALVDADPFGLHIFQQYQAALAASHPGRLKLLGVLQGDLERFGVADASLIPLERLDCKRARSMLNNLTPGEDGTLQCVI